LEEKKESRAFPGLVRRRKDPTTLSRGSKTKIIERAPSGKTKSPHRPGPRKKTSRLNALGSAAPAENKISSKKVLFKDRVSEEEI